MKNVHTTIFLFILLAALLACKKENHDVLGVYSVHHAVTGPPSMEWYHRSYDLEISKSGWFSKSFYMYNYANKNSSFNGTKFKVECTISDDAFTILEQEVDGVWVQRTSGHFSNDSLFFDIAYVNTFGEVFFGHCSGARR